MKIIGGAVLLGDSNGSGMRVAGRPYVVPPLLSGDANVSLGTTVQWTSNTWLYLAEGQANVRSIPYDTVNYDTNNMVWQLFYAHQSIRLPVSSGTISATGGGARMSSIVRQSGTNSPYFYGAVSGADANLSDFKSNTDISMTAVVSITYAANTLWQGNVTNQLVVPANRFFMLGFGGGPYYRNFRRTANNYTAVNGNTAIFTVINQAYAAGWPSGPVRGIPTQLKGNTASYYSLSGNILLAAVKFEVV